MQIRDPRSSKPVANKPIRKHSPMASRPSLASSHIPGAHSKSDGPLANTRTGRSNNMSSNHEAPEQEHTRIRSRSAPNYYSGIPPTNPGQATGSNARPVLWHFPANYPFLYWWSAEPNYKTNNRICQIHRISLACNWQNGTCFRQIWQ